MTLYMLIWFIGVIIAYYILRYRTIKHDESLTGEYSWDDVLPNLVFAVWLSWIMVIGYGLYYLIGLISSDSSKPPKWL